MVCAACALLLATQRWSHGLLRVRVGVRLLRCVDMSGHQPGRHTITSEACILRSVGCNLSSVGCLGPLPCLRVQVAGMASRSLVRSACRPARARVVRVHTGCRGVCRAVGAPAAHTPPKPGCTSNSSPDGRRHHRVGAPRTRTHDIEHGNCEQEPNYCGIRTGTTMDMHPPHAEKPSHPTPSFTTNCAAS